MLHREKSHTGLVILRDYKSKCKQAEYIELARARRGQERCLKCSSHAVIPYKLVKEGEGFKEKGDFIVCLNHDIISLMGCLLSLALRKRSASRICITG